LPWLSTFDWRQRRVDGGALEQQIVTGGGETAKYPPTERRRILAKPKADSD
jgi:hypothetical protein